MVTSNVLSDRLTTLLEEGVLTKGPDPAHKQKAVYATTEKVMALVPVFAHLGMWGSKHLPASEELSARSTPG